MHPNRTIAGILAVCLVLAPLSQAAPAQQAPAPSSAQQGLDKLLAPIALYPDALLAQVLACATSPQQVTEVNKWLEQNKNLKGSQLQDAATKQGFDASFVALAVFPDVLAMMGKNMEWTEEVGKAFLSDQKSVLESVQRLRAQAQAAGNLKTTEQQTVTTEKTDGQQVIVIQPTNPQVIYVPVYNTQTVYVQAPPPPPQQSSSSSDAAAAALIGFGLGIVMGAAMADNHYYYGAWGMSWHSHTVVVAGGGWHVPPGARYPYTRPVAVPRGGVYAPRNVYAPQYNNVNINVDRSANVNNVNRSANVNTARPTTASNASRPAGQPAASQAARPSTSAAAGASTRGYGQPSVNASTAAERSGTKSSAFSGYQNSGATRQASQRGQRSASASASTRSSGRTRK
ncbi:MAG: hypothetical protein H6Q05_3927 [Acidobacteria bacterium]|nr:hypothetical protein [Acidobacteriota bacterium]